MADKEKTQLQEKLRTLLGSQKELVKKYEDVVMEFASDDIIRQNYDLKKQVEEYKRVLSDIENKYHQLQNENQQLKIALKEQIMDEKLNILKVSRQKIRTYFQSASEQYENSLLELEHIAAKKLEDVKITAGKELEDESKDFLEKIEKLQTELKQMIHRQREKFTSMKGSIATEIKNSINRLEDEEVSEEIIRKRIKENNVELKIGLSWINKVGIFLILVGVATASKYTYSNFFNDYMKGIFFFIIGGLLLAGGEWFSRKEKSVFAQGLTGGGIAVLYYAIFSSYFMLEIISMNIGMVLSVLVTMTALTLSLRYRSKTICSFALIGGYLPFFTYAFVVGLETNGLYIAMGYLFILNLLTLFISFYQKWNIVNYISFLLNVPTLAYLVTEIPNEVVGIVYSILTFSMYLIITIAHPFQHKNSLKISDVILLGMNTLISCVMIYVLFEKAKLDDFRGALALVFCLIYLGLGQWVNKYMKGENSTRILFFITSFTFAVLMVPFQFGVHWFTMGWLVEGILLILYGYKHRHKHLEQGGWIVFGLCLAGFFLIDLPFQTYVQWFDYRYLAVTAGTMVTLLIYLPDMKEDVMQKYSTRGKAITVFKNFALVHLCIYLLYTGSRLFDKFVVEDVLMTRHYNYMSYFKLMLMVFIAVIYAYVVPKISIWYDKFVKYFSTILYIIADFLCMAVNVGMEVYVRDDGPIKYFVLVTLLLYNIIVFLSIKDLLLQWIQKRHINLEVYPLVLSVYLLGTVTALLIVQFDLGEVNLLFSLLYLAAAFTVIVYGFRKQYILMRRFGLGLSMFATGKLFIYDLSFLKIEGKIVSYFAFGVVLLGISYLYQKFKSALDVGEKIGEKT